MSKINNENQHRKPTLKTTLKINIEKNSERRKKHRYFPRGLSLS